MSFIVDKNEFILNRKEGTAQVVTMPSASPVTPNRPIAKRGVPPAPARKPPQDRNLNNDAQTGFAAAFAALMLAEPAAVIAPASH